MTLIGVSATEAVSQLQRGHKTAESEVGLSYDTIS